MSSEDNPEMMDDETVVEDEMEEAPAFVNPDEAVEVQVDDDAPMDDDEDENDAAQEEEDMKPEVEDMSVLKIESHNGPVYAVACHFDGQKLTVVTGGGDDRAFLHHVQGHTPASRLLEHTHTDSVSTVALNTGYVSEDLTKTPRLAAVGAYDGGEKF